MGFLTFAGKNSTNKRHELITNQNNGLRARKILIEQIFLRNDINLTRTYFVN